MTTVHAQACGDQALLPRAELERLVELARQVEPVEFELQEDDLPVNGLMLLADSGGAFDWLLDEPDLYTASDCKVRYK